MSKEMNNDSLKLMGVLEQAHKKSFDFSFMPKFYSDLKQANEFKDI